MIVVEMAVGSRLREEEREQKSARRGKGQISLPPQLNPQVFLPSLRTTILTIRSHSKT